MAAASKTPRDFSAELKAAREAQDWTAHARIWEERRHAEVDADESILRIDGATLDLITKDQITTAANTADIDAALLVLQNIAGITDGGIASQCFSGFEWDAAQPEERFSQIVEWLKVERIHHDADALQEIERLAEWAKPFTENEWGSERQIDAQNAFTQALEQHLPPAEWGKFEASLDKASTEDIIRNGLEITRATFA